MSNTLGKFQLPFGFSLANTEQDVFRDFQNVYKQHISTALYKKIPGRAKSKAFEIYTLFTLLALLKDSV
jgi:hypothetical protein